MNSLNLIDSIDPIFPDGSGEFVGLENHIFGLNLAPKAPIGVMILGVR